MLPLSTSLTAGLVLAVLYYAGSLFHQIRKAKAIGLPLNITPSSIWFFIDVTLFSSRTFRYVVDNLLPLSIADNLNHSAFSRRWATKDRMFHRFGGCFMTVKPFELTLDVCDADVVRQICSQRYEFPKSAAMYDALVMYGPNLVSSDNKDWPRHRHHAAPGFNEKNNTLVWSEAISQTMQMVDEWRESGEALSNGFRVKNLLPYIHKLILQVLASAAFGVRLPYTSKPADTHGDNAKAVFEDSATPPAGFRATFRSVSQYMSVHFTSVFFAVGVVPQWVPKHLSPFLKPRIEAYEDMGNYLKALIEAARDDIAHDKGTNNLLKMLVKSNEESSTKENYLLSAKEMIGNIHVFTLAGFETTATTLRYTLVLLCLHPDKQQWLRQEIKEALRGQPEDPNKWSYTEVFPKLIAPLCVMMETLRLYPPVTSVPKSTGSTPSTINFKGKTHVIPPGTDINMILNALHYRSDYWGPDVRSFVPERWDARNKESFLAQNDGVEGLIAPGLEYNTLHKPIRGSYLPFSDGNRACIGKKFAQVEYVAILAIIFRDYEVSLAKISPNESQEATEKRAWKVLGDSFSVITITMQDDVPLNFQRV